MSQDDPKPKIGAGHASAMYRQGLAELRAAVFPDSNVAQPPQYGLYGTRTPGEVMQERSAEGRDPDEQPPTVHGGKEPAGERGNRERKQPELDRD